MKAALLRDGAGLAVVSLNIFPRFLTYCPLRGSLYSRASYSSASVFVFPAQTRGNGAGCMGSSWCARCSCARQGRSKKGNADLLSSLPKRTRYSRHSLCSDEVGRNAVGICDKRTPKEKEAR